MPNCTCYAFGRAYELLGKKPKLSIGYAKDYYGYNKTNKYYRYGSSPKLGAIACWSGGMGHVAVVEKIDGNKLILSESSYGGEYFHIKTFQNYKNGLNYGNKKFQGFIYILG